MGCEKPIVFEKATMDNHECISTATTGQAGPGVVIANAMALVFANKTQPHPGYGRFRSYAQPR
jgi:hypothetical protein